MNTTRASLQGRQYAFPYHHLAFRDAGGEPCRHRVLPWGLEYLCCLEHLRLVVEQLQPDSVLDVGCGDGRLLGLLDGVSRRRGIDIDARAVAFARAFVPDAEISTGTCRDVRERFDVVTASEVIEHLPASATKGFVRDLSERVRAGGRLVLTAPTANVPLQPKHYRHYDAGSLAECVAASGAQLVCERIEHLFRQSAAVRIWQRATCNRCWFLEVHALRGLVWRYVWTRLRRAGAGDGRRVLAVFRKPERPGRASA